MRQRDVESLFQMARSSGKGFAHQIVRFDNEDNGHGKRGWSPKGQLEKQNTTWPTELISGDISCQLTLGNYLQFNHFPELHKGLYFAVTGTVRHWIQL